MLKKKLLQLVPLSMMFFSLFAHAAGSGLALSYGKPTTNLNKSVSTFDLAYERALLQLIEEALDIGISAKLGHFRLDDESGTRLGFGAYAQYRLSSFWVTIPIGVNWLDKTVFGENERITKDYGGAVQFIYGAELGYQINNTFGVFYRFEHMSNAKRYEHNPALNTHNLGLKFSF